MYRFLFTTFVICVTGYSVSAQSKVESLIQAEKDFAALTAATGTRDGFLAYADSNAVMLKAGVANPAITTLQKRPGSKALLNWFPKYAEISASADFGFTSGPWTWQPHPDSAIAAHGQYATVWHKDKKGNWKFLVDLGIETPTLITDTNCIRVEHVVYRKYHEGNGMYADTKWQQVQMQPVQKGRNRYDQYKPLMATGGFSLICHEGKDPAFSPDQHRSILNDPGKMTAYKSGMHAVAASADLAYTWGSVQNGVKKQSYLRIWRYENNAWKLALEMICD